MIYREWSLNQKETRGSGMEGLAWAGKFGVCPPGSLPGSNGTAQSPEAPTSGGFPKSPAKDHPPRPRAGHSGDGPLVASAPHQGWRPLAGAGGETTHPPSIHGCPPLMSPLFDVLLLSHTILFSQKNLAAITLFILSLIVIISAAFPSIRWGGGGADEFHTLL